MPYKDIKELPEKVKNVLPKHAQEIYKEAFNHAFVEYTQGDKEALCHKVAWSAVKKNYHKGPTGKWEKT